MTTLADDIALIQRLIEWAGSNAKRVADSIGAANTTINRFANGSSTTRLSRKTIAKLQQAYPEFPGWAQPIEANAVPFKMEGASTERMRDNLPILGSVLGAARYYDGDAIEQTTLNTGEVLQYVRRPVLLNERTDVYGVFVVGSSMAPRHMEGETIIVDPKGRLRNGDDVVVYLRTADHEMDDGNSARAALVKRLVRRTSTYIDLEQFTPPKEFRVEMDDVVHIHRVVPWSELL